MKKDLIFAPCLLALSILLGLLKVTGLPVHIIVSVLGVAVLIVYTVLTKKEWKITVLEIVMRVLYGVALISGVLIINIHGVIALNIAHKLSALLFIVSLIAIFVFKLVSHLKK